MKNVEICKGCKYFVRNEGLVNLQNTCNYLSMTGKSRYIKEEECGGYKEDSCICYEKKIRERRRQEWAKGI